MERRLLRRTLHVDDELERLVLDPDRLRGSPRLLGVLGRHDGDRLALVADALVRKHRLIEEFEPVSVLSRDVSVREHGVDAGHRYRLRDVDAGDARVRVRAPQRVAPEHPRRVQVAGVRELARRLGDGVDAPPLDDGAAMGKLPRDRHPAATLTASRILA